LDLNIRKRSLRFFIDSRSYCFWTLDNYFIIRHQIVFIYICLLIWLRITFLWMNFKFGSFTYLIILWFYICQLTVGWMWYFYWINKLIWPFCISIEQFFEWSIYILFIIDILNEIQTHSIILRLTKIENIITALVSNIILLFHMCNAFFIQTLCIRLWNMQKVICHRFRFLFWLILLFISINLFYWWQITMLFIITHNTLYFTIIIVIDIYFHLICF